MVKSESTSTLKMFWEVWRNVTGATTSWSLGGNGGSGGGKKGLPSSSSSSTHKTRYNRLNGRPTKSQSQPANLTSLTSYSSSTESLTGCGTRGDNDEEQNHHKLKGKESEENQTAHVLNSDDLLGLGSKLTSNHPTGETNGTSTNFGVKNSKKNANGMKHSFSSFFPFTSCATTSASSPPPAPTSITLTTSSNGGDLLTGKFPDLDQQGIHLENGSSFPFPSEVTNLTSTSATTNGNNETSSWDLDVKKEMGPGIYNDEEEISDLDDEVEHLTCDVCERAFPTLKLLARHQRKKRHYGCLQCDSIFPSREVLECHREQMCHYDYAIDVYDEDEDEENFFESDDDENGLRVCDEDCDDEERERLL